MLGVGENGDEYADAAPPTSPVGVGESKALMVPHNECASEATCLSENRARNRVFLACVAVSAVLICVAQLVCGIIGNSLVLLIESAHMFVDSVGYGINFYAELKQEDGEERKVRALDLFAAGFNIFTLLGTTTFIFYEGIHHFVHPHTDFVDSTLITSLGATALVFNASFLIAYAYGVAPKHSHSHSMGLESCNGHSHGHGHGHGHSHSHSHSHGNERTDEEQGQCSGSKRTGYTKLKHRTSKPAERPECCKNKSVSKDKRSRSLCARLFSHGTAGVVMQVAVWHVMSDLFESLTTVTTGIILKVSKPTNKGANDIDAGASLLLGTVILVGTVCMIRVFMRAVDAYRLRKNHGGCGL